MDFLEILKAFLVSISALLRMRPKLFLPRSQPPAPPLPVVDLESHQPPTLPSLPAAVNDPETLQPESPPYTVNQLESSQPPTSPSTNDPEALQQDNMTLPLPPPPPSSTLNIELLQPPFPTQPLPPTPTTPSNLKQIESILAAQQQLQWKNSVLTLCFSYALAVSLPYAQSTDHQASQPNSSLILLSFFVLLTFNLIIVAFFISSSCKKTSEVLEKVAFLVASAAFCHATAIPFPFELKCAVLLVFLLPLLLITIFRYLNRNSA